MKTNILFTVAFLIFLVSVKAQTTITTTIQIGDATPFAAASDATAVTVPVNIVGANVTWDCSNLQPEPGMPIMTLTVSSPAGTQYSSDYPQANWYWTDPAYIAFVGHHDYSFTPDSLALWGEHTQGESYEIYDNPEMELKLPFSYGDIYVNNYSKTNFDAFGNMTSYQTGSNTLQYDSYGTLILPSGTFSNVGRIKNTRTNSLGSTTVSYDWRIISTGERIMNYGTNGGISVSYRSEMPTGIPNKENMAGLSCSPNPFIQQTELQLSPELTAFPYDLKMVDVTGKLVKTVEITASKTMIQRQGLESGVYFCFLEKDKRIVGKGKLVVD